jgi:hypothetical protein
MVASTYSSDSRQTQYFSCVWEVFSFAGPEDGPVCQWEWGPAEAADVP